MNRDQLEALIALQRQTREERLAEFSSLSSQAESLEKRVQSVRNQLRTSKQTRHRERVEAFSSDIVSIGEVQYMADVHEGRYDGEKELESEAERLETEHRVLTASMERARNELGESIGTLKVLEARLETVSDSERLEREKQDEEH